MNKSIWFEPITIDQFTGSMVNMDKALGIEVTEIGDDYIIAKMPVTEKTKQPYGICLLYTSPSPRDGLLSRMPSSA